MCSRRSCNCASHRIRSKREGNSTSEGHSTCTAHTQQATMERARAATTPGGRGSGKDGLEAAAEPRKELGVFRDALPHEKVQARGGGRHTRKQRPTAARKSGGGLYNERGQGRQNEAERPCLRLLGGSMQTWNAAAGGR
jgi:hypothetical protein